jgi:molecular chaperone GrpE (heat shock protein)
MRRFGGRFFGGEFSCQDPSHQKSHACIMMHATTKKDWQTGRTHSQTINSSELIRLVYSSTDSLSLANQWVQTRTNAELKMTSMIRNYFNLRIVFLFLTVWLQAEAFKFSPSSIGSVRLVRPSSTRMHEAVTFEDQEVTSKEIERLQKKIDDLNASIATTREQRTEEEKILEQLDAEFGGEIARIRKEFARMKERSIEEAVEISNKAKSDALKEVLPITDNYYRAKTLFEPLVTEGDKTVMAAYDNIFAEFMKVIEGA